MPYPTIQTARTIRVFRFWSRVLRTALLWIMEYGHLVGKTGKVSYVKNSLVD